MRQAKRALISGASGAIGKSIAEALAKDGYNLLLHYYTSSEEISMLAEKLQGLGAQVDVMQADLSKQEEVLRLLAEIDAKRYEVDLLVNNAGISECGLFTDLDQKRYKEIMDINFNSAALLSQKLLPYMVQRQYGNIINISSMWGIKGVSCEAVYAASKAALVSLTRSLAREYGPSGIRVNAVAPGVIESEMLACFTEEERRDLAHETPLFRLGKPEEVAAAVRFLASDEASFITGHTLLVDGGFTA